MYIGLLDGNLSSRTCDIYKKYYIINRIYFQPSSGESGINKNVSTQSTHKVQHQQPAEARTLVMWNNKRPSLDDLRLRL